jgi:5-methylcytosine-specific restriction endonuclease McrA
MHDVLLLNADFTPIRVVSWKRAVCLLMREKVRMVAQYEGRLIRSPSFSMAWPAVICLTRYARFAMRPKLNRRHLLARDRHQCQYCGLSAISREGRAETCLLTMDHVVPRSQAVNGRVRVPWVNGLVLATSWENLVAACAGCNRQKANRTPAQAGMRLRSTPRPPGVMDGVRIAMSRIAIPPEWEDFVA